MASTRQVIIDDASAHIQYTGNWFVDAGSHDGEGVYGPAFRTSEHATQASTASLSFAFAGTSIAAFGTIDSTFISNRTVPWTCFLDGVSIGSVPFEDPYPDDNWPLCIREGLRDAVHTLTFNVTNSAGTVWFDVIHYTPGPTIPLSTAVVLVPNDDPDIHYGTSWTPLQRGNATSESNSQISFDFNGKYVGWVGWIPGNVSTSSATAMYSVDGGPSVKFFIQAPTQLSLPPKLNQLLFTTAEYAPGPHSIVVTYQGTPDTIPLTLDYLFVVNGTTAPSGSPPPGSSKPTSSGSPSGTSHTKKSIVGPLVGGILAAVFILACALIFLHSRRRRGRKWRPLAERPIPLENNIVPFQVPHGRQTPFRPDTATNSALYSSPFSPSSEAPTKRPFSNLVDTGAGAQASANTDVPPSGGTLTLMHIDSGFRRVTEIPPSYSPI